MELAFLAKGRTTPAAEKPASQPSRSRHKEKTHTHTHTKKKLYVRFPPMYWLDRFVTRSRQGTLVHTRVQPDISQTKGPREEKRRTSAEGFAPSRSLRK